MTDRLVRLAARIDRLPPAWLLVVTGFVVQTVLVASLLGLAAVSGDRLGLLVAGFLGGLVAVAGLVAVPVVILLRRDRFRRAGALFAAIVGVGLLVLAEGHLTVWPSAVALLAGGVRGWVRAGLNAADLLRIDPDRFERVPPPDDRED